MTCRWGRTAKLASGLQVTVRQRRESVAAPARAAFHGKPLCSRLRKNTGDRILMSSWEGPSAVREYKAHRAALLMIDANRRGDD